MQSEFQDKLSKFLAKPGDSSWEELQRTRFSEFEATQVLADIRDLDSLSNARTFLLLQAENRSETSRLNSTSFISDLLTLILDRLYVLKEYSPVPQSQDQPKGQMDTESHSQDQPKGQKETGSHSQEKPKGQKEIEPQSPDKTEVQSRSQDQTDIQSQSQDIVEIQLLPQESDPIFPYYIDKYSVCRDFIRIGCVVFGFFFLIILIVGFVVYIMNYKSRTRK